MISLGDKSCSSKSNPEDGKSHIYKTLRKF